MKELYVRNKDGRYEFFIVSDDEPYARGFIDSAPRKHDIIAAKANNSDKNLGFFFSDIGVSEAFCDDNMPKRGTLFPATVISLPEGGKTHRIIPVISFNGLFVHVDFLPSFSKRNAGETFTVSRKISEERASALASEFKDYCGKIKFDGYTVSFTLRTLCGDENVKLITIKDEIDRFADRFKTVLDMLSGSRGQGAAPGTLLYENTVPEYISAEIKTASFDKIVTCDPKLSLSFEEEFGRLPERPKIKTRPDFDRLFDIVPGLMKLPSYLGRTLYTRSGARIIYDKTEAMHVFDINSCDSALDSLGVNLECCEIIARAVSVRNLTGIIMCDFINMKSKEDEEKVIARMRELAGLDYRPFKIHGFTALKVLECSRNK